MTKPDILIIEDEAALAKALAAVCERLGRIPQLCASGTAGLKELASGDFKLVVLDLGLPDRSGLEVLEEINRREKRPPVLIITAHGTLKNAVSARKLGAAGYLVKPLDLHELEKTLREILLPGARGDDVKTHFSRATKGAGEDAGALLGGTGPEMQRVFVAIANAANSNAPAIITGPTGTGKTLAAHVIHANSRRRDGPFVTLLCGAIPEHLLESELFGHEKNAFTGAAAMRPGHIERAAGGTLLLDEVADIPVSVQAKLLRFVEERTFNRIGGREDIRVDMRLIAATNRSLREEVQAGRFREDLYYRLHVLEIELPPLQKRRGDVSVLSAYFLSRYAAGRELAFSAESNRILTEYSWPGNVRELRNTIEHAVAVCSGGVIQPHHFPASVSQPAGESGIDIDGILGQWVAAKVQGGATYKQLYSEVESTVLKHLLERFRQKPTILARVLKMNRATLLKKRRALGLDG
jgi:DNA-binding NtrC family response regulator